MSTKHLQAYLNEFTFRFNRRFYPFNAFRSLLGIAGGVEAPTYAQLYSGEWIHPTSSLNFRRSFVRGAKVWARTWRTL